GDGGSFVQDRCDLSTQVGDLARHDVPDQFVVDTEVRVHQMITHPATARQPTPGCAARNASGSFFAASPMTSRRRTNARLSVSSESNCSAERSRLDPIR